MKTAILTTTFYRTPRETRFHLASQMIGNAIAAGYGAVIVDGSPVPDTSGAFLRLGASVFPQTTPGMGPSRRELFSWAGETLRSLHAGVAEFPVSDADIFVWTEEKPDLIRSIPQIVAPIERGEADAVVPTRMLESFQGSYPKFQFESEQRANAVFREATGRELDIMFGPIAFRRELLPIFANCNPAERYGLTDTYIQHVALMEAMALGYRVASVSINFFYPPVQKAEEEGPLAELMWEKRVVLQFKQCTNNFRTVAAALKLKP